MNQRVDVKRDPATGFTHFVVFTPGAPGARKGPTACGLDSTTLASAAWFPVGDPRGRVHFARACDTCANALSV